MNYSVSSDLHFSHGNMTKSGKNYCNRPFRDIEHMGSEIIRRHNERVKPEDQHLFVGDFCFNNTKGAAIRGEGDTTKWTHYWNQMNGHKTLLSGNHDSNNSARTPAKMMVLEFGGFTFGATHCPEDVVRKYLNLGIKHWIVGHVHNSWPRYVLFRTNHGDLTLINVSLDVWNFYPVRLTEIVGTLRSKDFAHNRTINAVDYLNRGRHNMEE